VLVSLEFKLYISAFDELMDSAWYFVTW